MYGKRELKYDLLFDSKLNDIKFSEIQNIAPNYYFVQKNFTSQKLYNEGFLVNELFKLNSVGIVSANDSILLDFDIDFLENKVGEFYNIHTDKKLINKILYRPFDFRQIYYDSKLVGRAREKVMHHFIQKENVGLNWIRPMSSKYEFDIFVSKNITDQCSAGNKSAGSGISYLAPLYFYRQINGQQSIEATTERTPNLNTEIVTQIATKLGLSFTNEKETTTGTFAPIDLLDYIYAVLHSPAYREKYKEFLKIDFPRVPYPTNATTFWQLISLGGELRQIHLLESPIVEKYITQYPIDGDNIVTKPKFEENYEIVDGACITMMDPVYKMGRVYINDTQFFQMVPLNAWAFYIGGYQPAQKWLKDRKGRTLEFDDILHYQKIIVALTETDRLMKEIYKIEII